jgi:hypothetical protein
MGCVQPWYRVSLVGPAGGAVMSWVVDGPGLPDVRTVDHLARLALLAARLGGGIVLTEPSPPFRDLLHLAGLGVQVEGEPERREEPLRVQPGEAVVHPGDLPP